MKDVSIKKVQMICSYLPFNANAYKYFFIFQSPRNGEDLSDAEGEHEANSHDEAAGIRHRDSSPEDGLNGQVRVKVRLTSRN